MNILVTGNAGFIGYHVAKRLLERGDKVVGIDNINDYYDPALKQARLDSLWDVARRSGSKYAFLHAAIEDQAALGSAFAEHRFDHVIHLAAQAGVRYSMENPSAYISSNVVGFTNVIEAARRSNVAHFTYASTSSVYGANTSLPFRESDGVDHPLQLYAATKRANELIAHSFSHLYGLPTTGLRFFTVYGPWGRPDMALFTFTKKILAGEPIELHNYGKHTRDFTYIDDVVDAVVRVNDLPTPPQSPDDAASMRPDRSSAPFGILNVGGGSPISVVAYVDAIEMALGKKAKRRLVPAHPSDVPDTFADYTELQEAIGTRPRTPVLEGIAQFIRWYLDYYGPSSGRAAR